MAYTNKSSTLRRRQWMDEGLLQAASSSFFAGYTGGSSDAVFHQVKTSDGKEGHTVVFSSRGNLIAASIPDREQAWGKGEKKRVFSSTITLRRHRQVVDNGDEFDAIDIGMIQLSKHGDSRRLLADKVIRWKDQALFDTLQGNIARPQGTDGPGTVDKSGAPTHFYQFAGVSNTGTGGLRFKSSGTDGPRFGYDELTDLCTSLETGGKSWGGNHNEYAAADKPAYLDSDIPRPPLEVFRGTKSKPMWMFLCDSSVMNLLRKGDLFKNFAPDADVRGMNNMVFTGMMAKFQNMVVVNAPTFFGSPNSEGLWDESKSRGVVSDIGSDYQGFRDINGTWQLSDTEIQACGMRQYLVVKDPDTTDSNNLQTNQTAISALGDTDNVVVWQGMPYYDEVLKTYTRGTGYEVWSRALVMGGNAAQIAWGRMPEYKVKMSQDFDITSQSACEYWMNLQKTQWNAELGGDYTDRRVTMIDWGIIPVDIRIA